MLHQKTRKNGENIDGAGPQANYKEIFKAYQKMRIFIYIPWETPNK